MTDGHKAIIRRHSCPLEPIATQVAPVLGTLPGLRAVLFDVYGTLLVSASGDIDATEGRDKAQAFAATVAAARLGLQLDGTAGVHCLAQAIRRTHEQAQDQGVEYPEVDIREIWQGVLARWRREGLLGVDPNTVDVERIALEYELRVNPVWPMPSALACLRQLRENGLVLGLVSNAQFFTTTVVAALFDQSLADLGFDPGLQFYSYEFRRAKPGTDLHERAAAAVRERGIDVGRVLYVGNDMLNDIRPAERVGFRSALFAGDARSLRLREGDERVRGVRPDLVVTDLLDLVRCVQPQ
jgi:putative hydrolase of the HAD superfamily